MILTLIYNYKSSEKKSKKIAMDNKIVAFWLKNHEDDCPIPLL